MNGEAAVMVPAMILKSVACCACQKIFNRRSNQEQRGKNPYLLNCGHSVCERCCQNVKTNAISCGECGSLTRLSSVNNISLSLSRNAYLEGRMFLGRNLLMMGNISYRVAMNQNKSVLQKDIGVNYAQQNLGYCYECSKAEATKACQQCDCNFCDSCWSRVHSSGKSLQKHVPMTKTAFDWNDVEHCKVHKGKVLEFFCRECKEYACPNCIVFNHQGENHKPVTLKERNTELFEDVDILKQEVNQNMKRMLDTVAEVKALREKVPCSDAFYEDLQRQIVQNFVHLHGVLQVAEESVLKRLEAVENAKRNRLDEILLQLDRQIEAIKVVMERMESLQNPEQCQKDVLLERILKTLTTLKNLPSQLVKSEDPGKEDKASDKPAVSFDDGIIERLKNYCTLNISTSGVPELESDCSDNAVFHVSQQPKLEDMNLECESAKEDDGVSVKSKNSDCSDDTKKLVVSTYRIKSSDHPLSVLPIPKAKPLNMVEGQAYPVCVSYVKDPGEFYVMRSSLRKQRAKIDILAPTLAARAQNPPTYIQKDEYYLVQYAVDKKWYRGRVVDILPQKNENNETVAVIYYLDYGNKQEVPLSRMRDMPKALREESPLAIKCKLFSCIPRNGTWCKGSTKVMLDALDTSVMTMYVMKVLPDCLEVDLCKRGTDESLDRELVSLRDMMVFMEYASFGGGKKKRMNLKYLTSVLPNAEDTFRGLITYVESKSLFYMQKIGPDTQNLLTLMDRLDNTYKKGNMKGLIYNPELDMPCAAIYPQDGKWYRGEIIDILGHDQLTVYYVDYGNKETVHWKSVRRLQPEFLKLVPQAIPCSLMQVFRPTDSKWKSNVKDHLESFSSDILRVFVAGINGGKLKVILYTSKNVCVNEEMLEDVSKNNETQNCSEVKSNIADDGSAVDVNKLRKRKKERKKESSSSAVDEAAPKEPLDDVFRTEVNILQASSPSDIYVSLTCFSSRAKELEKELQEFYGKSEPESESKWEVDDRCVALSCKQEKWYRATIEEILDNDQMRVVFKDIMETEDVPVSNIRKLDDRFFSYPIGAIKCHLSGIFPPETEWPGLTCEFLQSQLDSYKHVYMTKMGEIDNNSLPIQLWVKRVTQGGALEPTMEEWVVLNDLIVEQGLAVPQKAKLIHHIVSEEELRLKNTVEWETPELIDDTENALDETDDSFIPSVSCDWPLPKPRRKDHFVGEATYVDFDAVIYIQDEEDKPTLDQIRASLLDYYDDSRPQAHDQFWCEGQLCIVKYHLDGGWHRGKIVKVNEDCSYKVLFVDYGNVETCRVTEMRKDIKHLDVPTLARRYVLHGVSPVSEEGQWQSRVTDYIYSSVVEKCCDVTIIEKSEDGIKPDKVRLKVIAGGYDLAEDLVKNGLAKFDMPVEPEKPTDETSFKAAAQVPILKSYSDLILPEDCTSFPIEVLIVKQSQIIVHISDHDSISEKMREIISEFVTVTDEIQLVAESQKNVGDFSRGVPCISLYTYNGTWYRAEVLCHDLERDMILVRYIDYGNEEYVTKDSIRKCLTKWFNVPKMALNLKLHNVRMSEGVEKLDYIDSLTECLSQPGLIAEVVKGNGSGYFVEVKKDGVLAYQEMLDNGLMEFVRSTDDLSELDLIEHSGLD